MFDFTVIHDKEWTWIYTEDPSSIVMPKFKYSDRRTKRVGLRAYFAREIVTLSDVEQFMGHLSTPLDVLNQKVRVGCLVTATKLRKLADRMKDKIYEKSNSSTSRLRPTSRRNRIALSMAGDAMRLQAIQEKLYLLAEGHENHSIDPLLSMITQKTQVETLFRCIDIGGSMQKLSEDDIKRLTRAGITFDNIDRTIKAFESLKVIYVKQGHKMTNQQVSNSEIVQLEREVLVSKIPGFYPTPKELAQKMVLLANFEFFENANVLEPSAGYGNIAVAIKEMTNITCDCAEINHELRNILSAKGFTHCYREMESIRAENQYDIIIMNPPFEKMQDVEHVLYCYDNLLKLGGSLVSITSPGWTFRRDKKARTFRTFINKISGISFPLPEKTFAPYTNANAVLMVIDKSDDRPSDFIISQEDIDGHLGDRIHLDGDINLDIPQGEVEAVPHGEEATFNENPFDGEVEAIPHGEEATFNENPFDGEVEAVPHGEEESFDGEVEAIPHGEKATFNENPFDGEVEAVPHGEEATFNENPFDGEVEAVPHGEEATFNENISDGEVEAVPEEETPVTIDSINQALDTIEMSIGTKDSQTLNQQINGEVEAVPHGEEESFDGEVEAVPPGEEEALDDEVNANPFDGVDINQIIHEQSPTSGKLLFLKRRLVGRTRQPTIFDI